VSLASSILNQDATQLVTIIGAHEMKIVATEKKQDMLQSCPFLSMMLDYN
jgi:hypothetical protein